MRLLAIDTSLDPCGMALVDENGIAASVRFRHGRDLSAWWAVRLRSMLESIGWTIDSLDGFGVCTGPGSFTGLRIGVTAAKTLAYSTGKPLIGIGTLDLLSLPYRGSGVATIASVLYCRPGEVYRAVYRDGDEAIAPGVIDLMGFAQELERLEKPLLLCGDPGARNPMTFPAGVVRSDPWLSTGHPERLAIEARARLLAGLSDDPLALQVTYLKRSQAEELADKNEASGGSNRHTMAPRLK